MIAPDLRPPRRVLILKPSALGDVVTAVPVLRGLRRTFPAAHLAWMLNDTCAPVMAHDTDLDEVILFERKRLGRWWRSAGAARGLRDLMRRLRAGRFDWVIDLQGLLRSGLFAWAAGAPVRAGFADAREQAPRFYTHPIRVPDEHTVDRNLAVARAMGVDARPADFTLQVTQAGRRFARKIARETGLTRGRYLVCVPPTRWRTKRWPVRHWRRAVRDLAGDTPVVLVGTPADRAMCDAVAESGGPGLVNLAGRTGVGDLVGVIAASGGVVCCDSAAKFIAAAVGVDCVTLIGPTRRGRTGPYGRGTAILAPVPCQGCLRRRCRHITCMDLIDPAEVISAARNMLAGEGRRCRTGT